MRIGGFTDIYVLPLFTQYSILLQAFMQSCAHIPGHHKSSVFSIIRISSSRTQLTVPQSHKRLDHSSKDYSYLPRPNLSRTTQETNIATAITIPFQTQMRSVTGPDFIVHSAQLGLQLLRAVSDCCLQRRGMRFSLVAGKKTSGSLK